MKKALLKKRCGIPAALLVALLVSVSGVAVAWCWFGTIGSTTKVEEPLTASTTEDFSTTMYPGQTNTWTFDVTNSATDVDYKVKADLTYIAPDGVSIASFKVYDKDTTALLSDETDDLLEGDDSAVFSIGAGETVSCIMTITANNDAATGDVLVTLSLNRG